MTGTEHLGAIELRHRFAEVNGVRLHWVEAGTGPLTVLVHGFPDFWYSWREQIPALVEAGRRVVAIDLRGYNQSGRPVGIEHYTVETLARDVIDLIRLLRAEDGDGRRALLVAHDWGGVVAWRVAARAPDELRGLVILNAPHPAAFVRELRRGHQLVRSWYAAAFQLPLLPEAVLRAGDYALLRRLWRSSAGARGIEDADLARYRDVFAEPGALTAALAYYRAAARRVGRATGRRASRVETRTLVIWGERDPALSVRLTDDLGGWVPDLRVEVLPNVGHWVQLEAPERVTRIVLDFDDGALAGPSPSV